MWLAYYHVNFEMISLSLKIRVRVMFMGVSGVIESVVMEGMRSTLCRDSEELKSKFEEIRVRVRVSLRKGIMVHWRSGWSWGVASILPC